MFGLTPSMAAAALVRKTLKGCSLEARLTTSGSRTTGIDALTRLRELASEIQLSERTSSAARGDPHGPIRAQKRTPNSCRGRTTVVQRLAGSARDVDEQREQILRTWRVGIRRNEEIRDVLIHRVCLVDPEQVTRRVADIAQTDSVVVDDEKRLVRDAARGRRGAWSTRPSPQCPQTREGCGVATASGAGSSARRTRRARVRARRRCDRPHARAAAGHAWASRRARPASITGSGAAVGSAALRAGDRRSAPAAGGARRTASSGRTRVPVVRTRAAWCEPRNSAIGTRAGGRAHAVGPERHVVVG